VVVVSIFFTLIFSTILSPFNCKLQADGLYVLWSSPSIRCFEGNWGNIHLPFIVIFILLYVIGFFGVILKIYKENWQLLKKHDLNRDMMSETLKSNFLVGIGSLIQEDINYRLRNFSNSNKEWRSVSFDILFAFGIFAA
jgi:membrane protease YdiL (CAAX protease family)